MSESLFEGLEAQAKPKRKRRVDPIPRFKPDRSRQLDGVRGCPALVVPDGHPARVVQELVQRFEMSAIEAGYSSLGRRGYHPRRILAVWLYASQVGIHYASEVERACVTDAAFRLLSGGESISAAVLKRFRRNHGTFFQDAIQQTVVWAHEAKLLDASDVAVDSVRLRAHASTGAVRSLERARTRLPQLREALAKATTEEARAECKAKIAKHETTVTTCTDSGRSSFVTTNASAALMKFPSGASAPGHRVTVAVAGQSARFVIGVLIDAATNDYGKLEPIVDKARDVLVRAGVPLDGFQIAADAGYTSIADLTFAAQNREKVDVLVPLGDNHKSPPKYFGRDRFVVVGDNATCPASRPMSGPYPDTDGRIKWEGVGCPDCALRPQCTVSKRARAFTLHRPLELARAAMAERMAKPDAIARYNRRIATVEPAFSSIEHHMRFRRLSSRHPHTVVAETLLKVLAHNILRLAARQRVLCVFYLADDF